MTLDDSTAADGTAPSDAGRFEFGQNWSRYLSTVDDERIEAAEKSLQTLLQSNSLQQRRFLDAGSGSGLFSLAAHRLGAQVTSFDVDPASVACGRELQSRFHGAATTWEIVHGSLTDTVFLSSLGEFDVVYCWGVAHHTGTMWQCLDNLLPLVAPGGTVVLAIYNDQQYVSRIWRGVKRTYQSLPRFARPVLVAAIGALFFFKRAAITLLAAALRLVCLRNPFVPLLNWVRESHSRGMHEWYDLVDWVGGWPFEVAKPEEVFRFVRDRGFTLRDMTTSLGHGCNEFVFVRNRVRA